MIPAGLRRCGPAEPGRGGAAAAAGPRHHPRGGGSSTGPHSGLWVLPRECRPLFCLPVLRFLLCSSGSLFFSFLPSLLFFYSLLSSPLLSSLPSFLPFLLWSRLPSPQCRPWTGGGGGWEGGEGGSGSVPGPEAASGCRAGPAPRPPSPPPRHRGGASVSDPPCPRRWRRRARRTGRRRECRQLQHRGQRRPGQHLGQRPGG